VALPNGMRLDYVSRMSALLEPGVKIFLVTFDYPQHEMSGPPFSVEREEVEKLYQVWCDIKLLVSEDFLERELPLKERGLSQLNERVYRLVVR
jgi:thiopurine S-methyltransferase